MPRSMRRCAHRITAACGRWRFVLIRGAARERLSELFVRRMRERDPLTPPAKLDKAASAAAHRAAGDRRGRAIFVREHKVPELEQLLSAGAAVMNLLNAFHAQGYGAIWLTGANAYDGRDRRRSSASAPRSAVWASSTWARVRAHCSCPRSAPRASAAAACATGAG